MNNILESILNHLRMNNNGALLVTGKWGSGKTYYLKNEVLPYVKEHTGFIPVIVSLYGEENRAGVAKKIIYGFLDSKSGVSDFSFQKVAAWISKAAPYIPKIKDYVDLSKILEGSGENFLKFLPHNKILIVLDDLERKSDSLEMADLFGLINDIVENFGAKVLLVANEEKIDENDLKFKEKTIEKTLQFSPDFREVFYSLFKVYEKTSIGDFLSNNKEFFILSLTTETGDETFDLQLKDAFSNIRTLKFAIEHFKSVYDNFFNKPDLSGLEIEQLKNIWIFILSISGEFKTNRLGLFDKKGIDVQATTFADLDLSEIFLESKTTEEQQENYSRTFKEKYFSRLGERYIFYPEIYDFLLGGFPINEERFLKNLQEKFFVEDGEVRDSYNLLNQIMRERWTFSGEEFISKLESLMGYVEKGDFEDVLSYLNAGNFLFEYSEFIGLGSIDVFGKIKDGLKIGLSRCEFTFREKTTLDMVKDQFTRKELVELIKIAEELLITRQNELDEQESIEIIELFKSDFLEFVSRFVDKTNENGGKYSSRSYLNQITSDELKTWLVKISLPEVAQLDHLIASRYLRSHNLHAYIAELEFLLKLDTQTDSIGSGMKSIEWYILKQNVIPKIKSAIVKLNGIKEAISRNESI